VGCSLQQRCTIACSPICFFLSCFQWLLKGFFHLVFPVTELFLFGWQRAMLQKRMSTLHKNLFFLILGITVYC
jgi:hypothetical protein